MRRLAVPCLAALLLLTGCSQVSALAPVGGNRVSEVRYAVNDLLVRDGTEILTAPVCEADDAGAVACTGTTVSGDGISASSSATAPDRLLVRVGERTLYDGSLDDVLDDALEGR